MVAALDVVLVEGGVAKPPTVRHLTAPGIFRSCRPVISSRPILSDLPPRCLNTARRRVHDVAGDQHRPFGRFTRSSGKQKEFCRRCNSLRNCLRETARKPGRVPAVRQHPPPPTAAAFGAGLNPGTRDPRPADHGTPGATAGPCRSSSALPFSRLSRSQSFRFCARKSHPCRHTQSQPQHLPSRTSP